MFDRTPGGFQLSNARIVTHDGIVEGGIAIEDGRIAEIGPSVAGEDVGGDVLIPGIVDIHTDHVEKHVIPRKSVQWNFDQALAAHDAVVIAGGTTTVFDSLCVGATMKNPERREILAPLIDALETRVRDGAFRADHLLHLRCEVSDPTTPALVDAVMGRGIVRLISVMDHTPGDRQSLDVSSWRRRMVETGEVADADADAALEALFERSRATSPVVRAYVAEAANAQGLTLMSHDDRSLDHVAMAKAEGTTVSEFPVTLEAARAAKEAGLTVVVGAPNYLRGGSQSGNVAVRELLAAGVVDALASDYVPSSPLYAAFALARDSELGIDLPAAVHMVATAPAVLAGLDDRGALEAGRRADIVRVQDDGARARVVSVWREGQRVY